jgi:hypothetical protein
MVVGALVISHRQIPVIVQSPDSAPLTAPA